MWTYAFEEINVYICLRARICVVNAVVWMFCMCVSSRELEPFHLLSKMWTKEAKHWPDTSKATRKEQWWQQFFWMS